MSSVANSLNQVFDKYRLVFWYDKDGEMRQEFDDFAPEGVEKVVVGNNEFGLKHRMMRGEPDRKFLVYMPYAKPAHHKNWFLDLELGNYLFYADGISLVLQEMGWQEEFRPFVEGFKEFFNSKERRGRLKDKLNPEDSTKDWHMKMLGVLCRESPTLEACLLALLGDLVEERDDKWLDIVKYGLDGFFWECLAGTYRYTSESPTLLDFAIELFVAAAPAATNREPKLTKEALLFLGRWKDSNQYAGAFEALSRKLQEDLDVGTHVDGVESITPLLPLDAFEAIECRVLIELREGIVEGRINATGVRDVIASRKGSHWYRKPKYRDIYSALLNAAEFFEAIRTLDTNFTDCREGIARYTQTYWKVDQLYRHFHFYLKSSGQATLLNHIRDEVDRRYSNEFLLQVGDKFQSRLEELPSWPPSDEPNQATFYKSLVTPILNQGKKLFVVISDALRYEVAEELNRRINKEDRFRSELDYRISTLPSYTQLGMAALLPHGELCIDPSNGNVEADGKRTGGLDARTAILKATGKRVTAVKADEFLAMHTKQEGRILTRDHDLIYIYQNWIDQVGDKKETEEGVFEAADKELQTLMDVLKKVAAVNGNNVLVTADHGFLYQNLQVDGSDFTETPTGEDPGMVNRRFAFAKSFQPSNGSIVFKASQLQLKGDYEVAFPKSINRYRKQGSGSRYVHGGTTLQEVVVPVLTINKSRTSDVQQVEVDIIRTSSNLITTSQATVSFYQTEPAIDKYLARTLRVGFYAPDGTLLSDQQVFVFDSTEEDARLREKKHSFVFGKKADQPEYRNKEVVLKLEEQIAGSNQYRTYKDQTFRLKKAMETDFEF